MSLNTSHTPDCRGVLIYNGEMILLYSSTLKMSFSGTSNGVLKGTKSGSLYLTSHRIIFMNNSPKDGLKSFAMPFHMLRQVKLEQPLLAPNYLKGSVQALTDGNFEGEVHWKLSFPKGGCIEFGQALLRANDLASRGQQNAPPVYKPTPQQQQQQYYAAPPTYYIPPPGAYQGFQAPTHVFPEQPPAGNVYMYEAPPPYPGIGQTTPYPAGTIPQAGNTQSSFNPSPNPPQYPGGGWNPSPNGPSYPTQGGPGYPTQGGPGYPTQGGYPTQAGYPTQGGYPSQNGGGYPPQNVQPGYPNPSLPPAYAQNQQAPPLPEKQ